jgi:hypothetical protein
VDFIPNVKSANIAVRLVAAKRVKQQIRHPNFLHQLSMADVGWFAFNFSK